jgi:epoxyqueuosine reductase
MTMDEKSWDSFSRGSAVRRAVREGFARNVAVALGNWGDPAAAPVLSQGLKDPDPLVRAHAAWALGQVGSAEAPAVLDDRLLFEEMEPVCEEIERALETGARQGASTSEPG